jgi:hypothetical protein
VFCLVNGILTKRVVELRGKILPMERTEPFQPLALSFPLFVIPDPIGNPPLVSAGYGIFQMDPRMREDDKRSKTAFY